MNNPKTNNSHLKEKIILRLLNLPDKKNIKVLDCFHGNGEIWRNIKILSKKTIEVDGIDLKYYNDSFSLIGDNLKILKSIDINKYDIIDLDAYGMPDEQIEIIKQKTKKEIIIFYTFITSVMGRITNNLLKKIGISDAMLKKTSTIFSRNQHQKFLFFLACLKLKGTVHWIEFNNKKFYGLFKINPE
jgi:hypothetical protein